MQFQSTTDPEIIKAIATHPAIWPYISDDATAPPEEWEPNLEPEQMLYILALDGSEVLGMWLFELQPAGCAAGDYKVHTAMLPNGRGPRAHKAAKEMALWIWEHTRCQRIVTDVPEDNRLAYMFARAAGMREIGRRAKDFLKGGQLQDVIMLGMDRPGPMIVSRAVPIPEALDLRDVQTVDSI